MENKNRLETISNLFEDSEIRSVWDSEKEEYYFSVVDVIQALTHSNNPRNYWNTLKRRMTEEEKSELYAKCVQLKMKSQKDGKSYLTDALDTGLLLCKDKDKLTVEWSLKNVNAPIGVASYKVKNAIQ